MLAVPPLEEQRAIAAVGEAFDRRIRAEERYLAQLREVKRALAQALLSGQVRLSANSPAQQCLPLAV
jgi:restriction endonuclease S subunit